MLHMAGESGEVATKGLNIALERDWDLLLDEIDEGEVVPIIGQDVLREERDGLRIDANLDFARKLAEILDVTPSGDAPSVASVAADYLRKGGARSEVYDSMEWLVRHAAEQPHPSSLGQLAEITPFRLFVTTTFDHWLKQALTAAGRTPVSLAYEPTDQGSDLPKDFEHRKEAFVYHLLGSPGASAFAVTEEDILEFMHQLLSPASARRPDQLFDVLEKSHLLFLGCRFPDWLTRFFVRMARGMPLGDPHGRRNWIVGGTVEGREGEGLKHFLTTSQRTKVFKDQSASAFIDELHARWTERHPGGVAEEVVAEPEAKDRVFLSYASEDEPDLQKICDALDEKKILYWFDKDELKGGDDWNDKIRRNIRSCSVFVPFMSKHVLTKKDRYFRFEWEEALARQTRFPDNVPFIFPVRLDDAVGMDAAEVPLGLLDRQWMGLPEFLERIVKIYRDKQRNRLDGTVVE